MAHQTIEDIRRVFSASTDFNEIFDAFESAVMQKITDVELYRVLFWNPSLTPDEVRLFGEKLATEFSHIAYDIFIWLARMFEALHALNDNYELAFHYFQKAAKARPSEPDPYLDACDCYEPDLNIPPIHSLIEFVKNGTLQTDHPVVLYQRLAHLYDLAGEHGEAELCRRKAEESDAPKGPPAPDRLGAGGRPHRGGDEAAA
jgi:hypothetical protein